MSNENSSRVVFLIDTHDPLIDAYKIKQIALQILLYFYDRVDKKVTWGYRFFSSESAATEPTEYSLYSFMPDNIRAFQEKCTEELRQETKPPVPFSPSSPSASTSTAAAATDDISNNRQTTSYSVLQQTMIQILKEFQWASGSTGSHLSTINGYQKANPTCFRSNKPGQNGGYIKNHVYMITKCPDTYESMLRYVGYTNLENLDTTDDQKIRHLAHSIHSMAQDLQKSLLRSYIKRQISFNWINTCEGNVNDLKYKSFQKQISNGMNKFLNLFGGHMIPYYIGLANHAKYGCSFATLFSSYHSSYFQTNAAVKQNAVKATTEGHTLEAYTACMQNGIKRERGFWEGGLRLGYRSENFPDRDLNEVYRIKLKSFFRTTHELSLEKRTISSSIKDIFARVSTLDTIAMIRNSDIQKHWFRDRFEEDKRLEFTVTSTDHDPAGFMDLVDSLLSTHQALVVDLQTHRAFRNNGKNTPSLQALVKPLALGHMNVVLLTRPIKEEELLRLDSISRLSNNDDDNNGDDNDNDDDDDDKSYNTHKPGLVQLDFGSLLELEPLSMISIDKYCQGGSNLPRIILHRSGEVDELLMRHKERKRTQEDLKTDNTSKKKEIRIIPVTDKPLESLPKNKGELFSVVRTLYLEALYLGKWTHRGLMKSLIACVNAATDFTDVSDIINLLSLWTKGWVDIDIHHKEISKYLNRKRVNISYNETRYIKIWKRAQLSNTTSSQKATLLKWLKMRETKLQIILYLTIISLRKLSKSKDLVNTDKKDQFKNQNQKEDEEEIDGVQNWRPMDRYSKIPEELVDIFFDRIQIWEITSSICNDLEAINSEREGCTPIMRIDPADIHLTKFVEDVAGCFSATLPNIVKNYREKISDNGKQNKRLEASQQFSICTKITNPSTTVNTKGGWLNYEGKPFDYHSVSSLERRLERARIEDMEDRAESPRLPKMARVDSAILADRLFQDEMIIDRNFPKFGENCEI